jgi:hypothetical protein
MLFVAQANLIALLLALLIGFVTAFWAFRAHSRPARTAADETDAATVKETPLP